MGREQFEIPPSGRTSYATVGVLSLSGGLARRRDDAKQLPLALSEQFTSGIDALCASTSMNTTRVGTAFEKEVFAFFDQLIKKGHFMVMPEGCKLYRQKKYYSRERESDIIFDIAIEVYRPGESTFSFRFLIECKKYKRPVEVGEIEEFHRKVLQVGSANTKAILVTSNSFQDAAFNFAKNNGIGLLRYFGNEDSKWVLNRSPASLHLSAPASRIAVLDGLLNESYRSSVFDIYARAGSVYTHSLSDFLQALVGERWPKLRQIIKSNAARRMVGFLSPEDIERKAELVLDSLNYEDGRVPLDAILEQQRGHRGLQFVHEPESKEIDGQLILGEIGFSPLRITLYGEMHTQSLRQRFTLAHELGHYFLNHGKYLVRELRDAGDDPEFFRTPVLSDVQRLEWQANYFAACLLLPRRQFVRDFLAEAVRRNVVDRGFGPLFVGSIAIPVETVHV